MLWEVCLARMSEKLALLLTQAHMVQAGHGTATTPGNLRNVTVLRTTLARLGIRLIVISGPYTDGSVIMTKRRFL
jgi:hypothetical protein